MSNDEFLNTASIAELLGYTRKYVTERIVTRPDFPKPRIAVSRQCRRWAVADVMAWASPDSRQSPQA